MTDQTPSSYCVLARKYRPQTFEDLVGQEGLVRVLSHALSHNRFPHALILTGTRGVGKTTTARLVARALNCLSPQAERSPFMSACGTCAACVSSHQERDLDVIEMDAASHTGVDDVRELIEAGRYKPLQATYKVYIIDEVHMLSKSAFNALLKTLEEPPAHLKFIFATTEIHKVPETILSRCMRFDLRRIEETTLAAHFATILEKEKIAVDPDALQLIARAADGSARDGLSLLDQALHVCPQGLNVDAVRRMLHLADRTQMMALFQLLVAGQPADALSLFQELFTSGVAPLEILSELLSLTHWLSLLKSAPDLAEKTLCREEERTQGIALSSSLSVPVLARFWQILLKGYQEAKSAPQTQHACEMVLIRLAHVAALPTPAELIDSLQQDPLQNGAPTPVPLAPKASMPQAAPSGFVPPSLKEPAPASAGAPMPESFEDLVSLVTSKDIALGEHVRCDVRPISYEKGRLFFNPGPNAPRLLASKLRASLEEWTGAPWQIEIKDESGTASLAQIQEENRERLLEKALDDPLVKATLDTFPLARIDSLDGAPIMMKKGA